MRLMLGVNNDPQLLVNVADDYKPAHFTFSVVNGGWDGVFTNGHITVLECPGGAYTDLGITEIVCNNQDRLRSGYRDYETVFDNFDNHNYVAPVQKVVKFDDMDDDIPF